MYLIFIRVFRRPKLSHHHRSM